MKYVLYFGLFFLFSACGTNKTYTAQEDRAYQDLKDLVNSKKFQIIFHTAKPMVSNALMQLSNTNILGPGNSASNINISGTSNRLEVDGDSIKAFLPFFGEQHAGGAAYAGNHMGIEFNDVPESYEVNFRDAKHRAEIKFRIDDQYRNNENYNAMITIFPNKNCTLQITSSTRSTIEYSGTVNPLKEDKKSQ